MFVCAEGMYSRVYNNQPAVPEPGVDAVDAVGAIAAVEDVSGSSDLRINCSVIT